MQAGEYRSAAARFVRAIAAIANVVATAMLALSPANAQVQTQTRTQRTFKGGADVVHFEYLAEDFFDSPETDMIGSLAGGDAPQGDHAHANRSSKPTGTKQNKLGRQPAGLWDWAPLGGADYPLSKNCTARYYEKTYLQLETADKQKQFTLGFFNRCQFQLTRNNASSLSGMLTLNKVTYRILELNGVKPFRLTFSDGESVVGFLAMKSDSIPRPLVVIRAGLFNNGSPSGSTSTLLAHFFDESPFHVMVLASQSSADNMIDNRRMGIGGFAEGREMMQIGRWLKEESSFQNKISSLHAFGISLGGSAALFTSLYNDLNFDQATGEKVFNSTIALCPVVDAKSSLESLYFDTLKSLIMGSQTWGIMKRIYEFVPDLHDLIRLDKEPKSSEWPAIISTAAHRNQFRTDPLIYLNPFHGLITQNEDEMWRRGNFLNFTASVQTPTLVWASRDDWIVDNKENAGRLEADVPSAIQAVNLDYGTHCAFSTTYGWDVTSAVFRSFVLKHSPEFELQPETVTPLENLPSALPDWNERHGIQVWESLPDDDFILHYQIWNPRKDDCRQRDIYKGDKSCYYDISYRVPRRHLDFLKLPMPQTQTEAQAQSRWLNSHVKLLDKNKQPLVKTRNRPKYLRWHGN